jgi:hypothetical protein
MEKTMNSNIDMSSSLIEIDGEGDSKSIDDDQSDDNNTKQQSGAHISRSCTVTTSGTTTTNSGTKRSKDISPCYVCGAKAHGYNFDQSNPKKRNEL